jgi:hypothetical protein
MPKKQIKDSALWEPRDIRRIAVEADVDPKTVVRYLDGEKPLRARSKARIAKALKELLRAKEEG